MSSGILQALGGLGLFLLGMSLMTHGLRTMADVRLQSWLRNSTKSPLQGVVTGGITTALVQSSSATTVAAVGFVNAGVIGFSEALGIIFGANIGTTITGWMVALLGFKLKLGEAVLPLILLGVGFRLFGRGTQQASGTALAGFGLIFVGISMLQQGMEAFQDIVTPENFPADTTGGRIWLVLIGVLITIITQSSSAGVAAALAAVNTGTISLSQAAAMVIGMDLGTTVTAAAATIGGNVQARRTGFAHVIYNMLTAVGAFVLLVPYLRTVSALAPATIQQDPEFVLVGFHTFFNTIGVIAILPFTHRFARMIERMFPERGNALSRRLDRTLLSTPEMALNAVTATIQDIVAVVFSELSRLLRAPADGSVTETVAQVDDALHRAHQYLQQVRIPSENQTLMRKSIAALHVLDHLGRVTRRLQAESRLRTCRNDPQLSKLADDLADVSAKLAETPFPISAELAASFQAANQRLKRGMRDYRAATIASVAAGELSPEAALKHMDAARWLRRIGYHNWRIAHHMTGEDIPNPTRP